MLSTVTKYTNSSNNITNCRQNNNYITMPTKYTINTLSILLTVLTNNKDADLCD